MLDWRLGAYEAWLKMTEPKWPNVKYTPVDFQDIHYYSAPKSSEDGPKSMDEVDPEIRRTFDKLGIPLVEQMRLSGVAVDAVFDSVSVATTFKAKLAEKGVRQVTLLGQTVNSYVYNAGDKSYRLADHHRPLLFRSSLRCFDHIDVLTYFTDKQLIQLLVKADLDTDLGT